MQVLRENFSFIFDKKFNDFFKTTGWNYKIGCALSSPEIYNTDSSFCA